MNFPTRFSNFGLAAVLVLAPGLAALQACGSSSGNFPDGGLGTSSGGTDDGGASSSSGAGSSGGGSSEGGIFSFDASSFKPWAVAVALWLVGALGWRTAVARAHRAWDAVQAEMAGGAR